MKPISRAPPAPRSERYALALSHANTLHRRTLPSRVNIAERGNDRSGVRDRLIATAASLVAHELVGGQRLAELEKVPGYRALASDVPALVALFKQHWSLVENKTPVTLAALNDAGNRAVELLAAVGPARAGSDLDAWQTLLRARVPPRRGRARGAGAARVQAEPGEGVAAAEHPPPAAAREAGEPLPRKRLTTPEPASAAPPNAPRPRAAASGPSLARVAAASGLVLPLAATALVFVTRRPSPMSRSPASARAPPPAPLAATAPAPRRWRSAVRWVAAPPTSSSSCSRPPRARRGPWAPRLARPRAGPERRGCAAPGQQRGEGRGPRDGRAGARPSGRGAGAQLEALRGAARVSRRAADDGGSACGNRG